jgi:hypothetical protein
MSTLAPPSIAHRGNIFPRNSQASRYSDQVINSAQTQSSVPTQSVYRRGGKGYVMIQLMNPCPVCGAETALAEIEPHPLHVKFEIHGYLCIRCGPVKSLVVLRSAPLQMM